MTSSALSVRTETRALVALSYPFWPLALIALLDANGSIFVRRQAWQALGFNLGMYGFSAVLGAIASLPLIGFGAWPLIPFLAPVWIVASVVYAFKVFQGDDVNVPIVSDWVDSRLTGSNYALGSAPPTPMAWGPRVRPRNQHGGPGVMLLRSVHRRCAVGRLCVCHPCALHPGFDVVHRSRDGG